MQNLLQEIKQCEVCKSHLPLGPKPIVTAHTKSKIVIIGQAPGIAVHKSGIPWDDKSGENLRAWMDIEKEAFYNPEKVAIIPIGFCYPGKGKTGDLAPRKECAPLWHDTLFSNLKDVKLILLIGKYAQDYYLSDSPKMNLTERVKNYKDYLPKYFVLPHPSPRNNIWQAKNEWFKRMIIPELQEEVKHVLK